jgi:hypothetical protein
LAILVGVLIKLILYSFLVSQARETLRLPGHQLYLESGDATDYIRRADQFVATGDYTADLDEDESRVFRMPGYTMPYVVVRHFVSSTTAKSVQVLFQVCLGGVAAGLVACLAGAIASRASVGVVALLLAGTFVGTSIFDLYLLPDGLAASLMVLVSWVLLRWKGVSSRFLAGALFAWAVFMRPFLLPLAVVFGGAIWMQLRGGAPAKRPLRTAASHCFMFLMPFLAADAAWVIRNNAWTGRLVILQTAAIEREAAWDAAWKLASSVGADIVFWRPETFGSWFMTDSIFHNPSALPPVGSRLFSEACTLVDLETARTAYAIARRAESPARDVTSRQAAEILNRCRKEYETSHPWDHHVAARGRLLRLFLIHSGPALPLPRFEYLQPFHAAWLFKILTVILYGTITAGGVAVGIAVLLRGRLTPTGAIVVLVPVYILAFFPLVIRWVELRYAVAAYPFLAALAAVGLGWAQKALVSHVFQRRLAASGADPSRSRARL